MKSLVYPSYTNKNVFKKESAEKFNQYHLPSKYKLSSIPSIAKKKKTIQPKASIHKIYASNPKGL
jgi:hypothetical protein